MKKPTKTPKKAKKAPTKAKKPPVKMLASTGISGGKPAKLSGKPKIPAQLPEEAAYAIEVLVSGLEPNPWNKQRPVDPEFVESVRAQGILCPILVRPLKGRRTGPAYQIIAGARRSAAALAVGLASVPAVVRDVDDATARQLTLVENVHRVGLTPWQEAEALDELLKVCDVAAAAAALGWPVWRARRRAKLLDLSSDWKKTLQSDKDRGRKVRAWPAAWLEEVALLPHNLQDEVLDDAYSIDDLDELKRTISFMSENLSAAPFDTKDATLCPAVGACASCPKRTGTQPDLFPDDLPGKKKATLGDRCLDKACWKTKIKAAGERKLAAVREKHGNLPFVSTDHYVYGEVKDRFPGIIDRDGYETVKKSDKGAVAALAVHGQKGDYAEPKVVYIKPKGDKAKAAVNKAEGKPVKSMGEKRKALELRRWCLVTTETLEVLSKRRKDPGALSLVQVSALSAVFGVSGSTSHYSGSNPSDWQKFDAVVENGETGALNALWAQACDTLAKELRVQLNAKRNPQQAVERTLTLLGLQASEFKAKADLAIPEPKSWAKAAPAKAKKSTARDATESLDTERDPVDAQGRNLDDEAQGGQPFAEGREAYEQGEPRTACPYPEGDHRRDVWLFGFDKADAAENGEAATSGERDLEQNDLDADEDDV